MAEGKISKIHKRKDFCTAELENNIDLQNGQHDSTIDRPAGS